MATFFVVFLVAVFAAGSYAFLFGSPRAWPAPTRAIRLRVTGQRPNSPNALGLYSQVIDAVNGEIIQSVTSVNIVIKPDLIAVAELRQMAGDLSREVVSYAEVWSIEVEP